MAGSSSAPARCDVDRPPRWHPARTRPARPPHPPRTTAPALGPGDRSPRSCTVAQPASVRVRALLTALTFHQVAASAATTSQPIAANGAWLYGGGGAGWIWLYKQMAQNPSITRPGRNAQIILTAPDWLARVSHS